VKVTGGGKAGAEKMLKGMEFVVSDRMNVVGEISISGKRAEAATDRTSHTEDAHLLNDASVTTEEASSDEGSGKKQHACSLSAPAIDLVIQQGATCVGITGSSSHNDTNIGWFSGEDCAAAVARGLCDFSFAIDEIGSAIGAAAISGVIAYRPTSGLIIDDGVYALSPTLSSVCIISREGKLLQQVSRALDVPKIEFQDTLERFLVAEDLFQICNREMIETLPAVIQTIKRWAGPDQAQSLSLCSWIYHRIPSVVKFVSISKDGQPSTEDILKGLVKASDIILSHEQENDCGNQPSTGDYRAALEVAEELSLACRNAMQEGLVFVIPSVPGFCPELKNNNSDQLAQFMNRCRQFASISNLAGIPQVSLPLDHPSGVLGISCLALQRKDYSLLRSADKIKSFLKEEVSTRMKSSSKKLRGRKSAESQKKMKEENGLVAERAKEEGNKCFKSKQYKDAIANYSRAISLDPQNPVYFSNRAMAYLKLGGYQQAEEDCTRALSLDPCLVKALLRRGASRVATCAFELAKQDFERVLILEPNNRQALQELRDLTALLAE
jgi:tetratricopeptide (TPR) repeat protein